MMGAACTTRAIRLCLVALASAAAGSRAFAGEPLTTSLVLNGLAEPTFLGHAPGDVSRLFVLEKPGRVRVIRDGALRPAPFLDLTGVVESINEAGLLGLAFHPDYARNGKFYLHYTGRGLVNTIVEYEVSEHDPDLADGRSAKVVLTLTGSAPYHYGGWIGFGPDGFLYVALGEGGAPHRSQDVTDELRGKLLRIDPNGDDFPADSQRNYALPPDNPFVGSPGDDEIWALGLRNPYRASFDRETGDLWIADVGEVLREEIDFQPSSSAGGANYGWGCMEGTLCNGTYCACNGADLTLPVHEYGHEGGECAVIGGAAYRGCAIPDLAGTYFFADWCAGRIWSFRYDAGAIAEFVDRTAELAPPVSSIDSVVHIGEDARGELYFVELGGEIFKLVPANASADLNGNGLADSCEPGDIDGDGTVGFADLTALLLAWGPCSLCIEDIDGDGAVGFADLTELLLNWG